MSECWIYSLSDSEDVIHEKNWETRLAECLFFLANCMFAPPMATRNAYLSFEVYAVRIFTENQSDEINLSLFQDIAVNHGGMIGKVPFDSFFLTNTDFPYVKIPQLVELYYF